MEKDPKKPLLDVPDPLASVPVPVFTKGTELVTKFTRTITALKVNAKPAAKVQQPAVPPQGAVMISDYSQRYDYQMTDKALFYKVKGGKTWADISGNQMARKNLTAFLEQQKARMAEKVVQPVPSKYPKHGTPQFGNIFSMVPEPVVEKPSFQEYYRTVPAEKNDTVTYDLERAYRDLSYDEMRKFAETGSHLPDTYKTPHHPTFSNESVYHNAEHEGGVWSREGDVDMFTPSQWNIENMGGIENYRSWWVKNEPGVKLNIREPKLVPTQNMIHPEKYEIHVMDARSAKAPASFSPLTTPDLDGENWVENMMMLAGNYMERRKAFSSTEKESQTVSKTSTVPSMQSYTGDTIPYKKGDKNRYYLPQYLDLSENRFAIRNRGDNTVKTNTPGIVITNFDPYVPAKESKLKDHNSVISVDKEGRVKAGLMSEFRGKDVFVSRSISNDVESFEMTKDGKLLLKRAPKKASDRYKYPITNVVGGVKGSVNVFVDTGDQNTFGTVTGGRLIFSSPDGSRQVLVSGSAEDIVSKFRDFKKDDPFVRIYSLDNGTYSRGLMKRDKTLTSKELNLYDVQNATGGTGLYITEQALDKKSQTEDQFKTYYYHTPFVRTKDSESFKKGHPLVNEDSMVVLHHTAYENPLTNDRGVIAQFLDPNSPNQASAHVVIEENGIRRVFAKPEEVAFHAGVSSWKGRDNVNDFSIGIEFQGNTLKKPLTQQQVESAAEYLIPLLIEKRITLDNIVTHEMITKNRPDPDKKPDIVYDQMLRVKSFIIRKINSDPKLVKAYFYNYGKKPGPRS